MSFENAYRDLAHQTVQYAAKTGTDEWGARTFATAVTFEARVTNINQRILDYEGRESLATQVVWVFPLANGTLPSFNTQGQLTLPDGSIPTILQIGEVHDQDSAHHVKILCGSEGDTE